MTSPEHTVNIVNESGVRARLAPSRQALQCLLTAYNVPSCRIEVLVTTEERMRELNMSFRNVPESTDVLTFPGPDWPGAPLGDIAVSMEFAKKGAAKRRVPVATELATLAVHGALHLLGFDDQTETDRADMVSRMNEVLALAGLPVEGDWSSQPHDGASD